MPVRTTHNEGLTWFVTFTCFEWLPLFEITNSYDLVYKWFNYLREKQLAEISAYVVMPNHLHALIHLKCEPQQLNTIVGNGKRFMAYTIIDRLKAAGKSEILERMQNGVSTTDKNKGQKHRAFETSFDAKLIMTDKFYFQKLHYIHMNPVSGKWNLASDFAMYEHSSAAFYEFGSAKHFTPKHYGETWLD